MNTRIDLMKHHYQIKKASYSELDLEDNTDKDYAHVQKEFKLKNVASYHGSYQFVCSK